jgi:hypothetical protein
MNTLAGWSIRFLLFTVLGGISLRAGGFPGFFGQTTPDVLTVTDVTEAGRSWPLPEPGKPVFYEAISFGSRNFPGLPGDVKPNPRAMADLIRKTLAEQGFLPAKEKGVAKIFLSIGWGFSRANFGSLGFLGGDKLDLIWELGNSQFASGPPRWMRSITAEKVIGAANSNLYIASIQAFDLEKLDAGEQVLLWHTRIACEARGLMMADAIPTMIVAAGPFIGRETKKPVWRYAAEIKKDHVDFGELKTIELIQAPAANGSSSEATKK